MFRRSGTVIPEPPGNTPMGGLKRFPEVLNAGWQVVDDPLQWILQRMEGSRWRNRSFCRTREGLLRCVSKYCGVVDLEGLRRLEMLPEFHA